MLQRPTLATLPATEAPNFSLGNQSGGKISTVSHSSACKVAIVDRRQEFEKRYYPGTTDPQQWRDAITVLPMEAFRPDLDAALQQQVQQNLANAGDYETIEIAVGAFHVALDERERGENQLLKDYKKWDDQREQEEAEKEEKRLRDQADEREQRRKERELGLSTNNADDDDSVGSMLVGGLFQAAVVQPMKRSRLRNARADRLKSAPQTLPVSLTTGKQSGWNCRLNAVVTLNSKDGPSIAVPVSVTSHNPKDDANSVEDQVRQVVAAALTDFGTQLQQPSR